MSDRTLELECVIADLKQQVRDAEKERDALRAKLKEAEENRSHFLVKIGKLYAQCDALHAKIKAMEKQEPIATVIKEGDSRYWMSERLWTFPDGKYPLYALPGAQGE